MSKRRVVNILIARDGISTSKAYRMVDECAERLDAAMCEGKFEEMDQIIQEDLGLEPDYIEDLVDLS